MKIIPRGLFFSLLMQLGLYLYSQAPQRIVSLAPSLTKMIYLLAEQKMLIGCTSYCEQAKKDNISIVATAMDVNIEKVLLLKPDLVVATSLTKPETIHSLEKVGIKVNVFNSPISYKEICSQFIELANLIGKQALAKKIVLQQQQRLNLLKQKLPKGKKPKIFFQLGSNPLFTVIPNTFMDDYITYAGGENIAIDLKIGTITLESVLLRDPDVILIVTMGMVGEQEKMKWMNYRDINASKNEKIFLIDCNKACSPNPVSFIDIVEQIITMLYP